MNKPFDDGNRTIAYGNWSFIIRNKILSALKNEPLSLSEIHKALNGHINAAAQRAELANLERNGKVYSRKVPTSGRPKTMYYAT